MAFAVLGMASKASVGVTGAETIATSFPGFAVLFTSLGAIVAES